MSWFSALINWLTAALHLVPAPLEADHSGPPADEHPPVSLLGRTLADYGAVAHPEVPIHAWKDGWWYWARRTPAHPGRIGPSIIPRTTVVHTTDTLPGGFGVILRSWTTTPGRGNAAHFLIGRSPIDGVVQFAPITKNANHAGGQVHGWWRIGGLVHPNTIAVGIEIDNGGRLERRGDKVVHPDTGQAVNPADVFWDVAGHPWALVTPWQFDVLSRLVDDLAACLSKVPAGTEVVPDGTYEANGVPWASAGRPDLVGHVSLDPVNKTDPGPQVMSVIRSW